MPVLGATKRSSVDSLARAASANAGINAMTCSSVSPCMHWIVPGRSGPCDSLFDFAQPQPPPAARSTIMRFRGIPFDECASWRSFH
jgi:hypothetical protein